MSRTHSRTPIGNGLSLALTVLFLALQASGYDKGVALEYLKGTRPQSEHERLLRVEALSLHDSAYAAAELPGLETLTGTRLEVLSRKLRVKKSLERNYSSEVYLLEGWYRTFQGHDTLYRTKARDLAQYLLARAALGQESRNAANALAALQNTDGSFSEKAGKEGSPALTALCAEALSASLEAAAFAANVQRATAWLMKDFGSRRTQNYPDLLHLLRIGPSVLSSSQYQKDFEALWDVVERAQRGDGSILGDLELTALSLKLFRALSGNLALDAIAFVSESGRPIGSATVGRPFAADLGFRPRFRDYEDILAIHMEMKSEAGVLLRSVDTVLQTRIAKNVARNFRLSLGPAGSVGAVRVSGTFTHVEEGDTLRDKIAERFFRVEDAPDLRFDGDSLRIIPVSPMAGDTASIRIRFRNAGQAVATPHSVVCLLRRNNGAWDTLGTQVFPYAGADVPIEYAFLTSLPEGQYDARILLDAGAAIAERDEANNAIETHFEVRSLPDLLFSGGAELSCSTVSGVVRCDLAATVRNGGTASAASFAIRLSGYSDRTLGATKDTVLSVLVAGSEFPVSLSFELPDTLPVTSEVRAVLHLNPDTAFDEKSLENNKLERSAPFSTGLNFALRESEDNESPIFATAGEPVTEKLVVTGSALDSAMTIPVRIRLVRDASDTLARLDTSLTFPAGRSSKPLEFSWVPTDSGLIVEVLAAVAPDSAFPEMTRADNFQRLRRAQAKRKVRFLTSSATIDSLGNLAVKAKIGDFLGKPVPGLTKGQITIGSGGVMAEIGALSPLNNAESGKKQIDVVLMDTHEPATLYRARVLYYELMPELKAEFARMGYSLEFKFRTPYFVDQTAEAHVRGDLQKGIFNGQIRNLLDEPDRTYKWAPAATYLATYHPWRPGALRVIVPMFSHLGAGEEINYGDPTIPNVDDSSDYHIEFADSCRIRSVHPYLFTNTWGFRELLDAETRAIAAIAGGELHFASDKRRMQAELRQFIVGKIADYEFSLPLASLPFPLAEGDDIESRLVHLGDTAKNSSIAVLSRKLELDGSLRITGQRIGNDTLFARVQIGNNSKGTLAGLRIDVSESEAGQVVSSYSLRLPSLPGISFRNEDIAIPLIRDTSALTLTLRGDYRDVVPGNDGDTLDLACPGCEYRDVSLYSDSLPGAQVREEEAFSADFILPWHDEKGLDAITVAVLAENGSLLYSAEVPASSPGFRQTAIHLEDSLSLAGRRITVRIALKDGDERRLSDNERTYVLPLPGTEVQGYFRNQIAKISLGQQVSTAVELTQSGQDTVTGTLSLRLRNRNVKSLTVSLLADSVVTLAPRTEPGREFYLDVAIRDTLSGLRHADFIFNSEAVGKAAGVLPPYEVNPGSFKMVQVAGPEPGKVYPLNVKGIRQGKNLVGYHVQWPLTGPRFGNATTHRLYFSYQAKRKFSDVVFQGDEIYLLNNFGSLYRLQSVNGALTAPVFVQTFPGMDSVRAMRLSAGDVNEDGFVDIVYTDKAGVYIRHGDASGSFGSPVLIKNSWRNFYGAVYPKGITEPLLGEFHGDGHLDLYLKTIDVNVGGEIYRGNGTSIPAGNGSFGSGAYLKWYYGAPGDVFRPMGWKGDLAALGYGSSSFDVVDSAYWRNVDSLNRYTYYGYGAGGLTGTPPNGLTVSDFDNDGKEDAILDYAYSEWSQDPGNTQDDYTSRFELPPTVAFVKGVGNGDFDLQLRAAQYNKFSGLIPSVNGWTEIGSMDNTDYNGDGFEDLIVTESSVPYRTMAYPGRGDFTFGPGEVLGYDSVSVFGMQVAYRRMVKAASGTPHVNGQAQDMIAISWDPALAGPGEYDLEAWWKQGPDSLLIGKTLPIRIAPALNVVASLASDRASLGEGEEFSGQVVLRNDDGMYPAASLRIQVAQTRQGTQTPLAALEQIAIAPSTSYEVPVRFKARSGTQVLVVVEQDGRSDSTWIPIAIDASQARVEGRISMGSREGIESFRTGSGLALSLTVKNAGLSPDALELLLVRQNLATLAQDTVFAHSATLAAGDSAAYSAPLSMSSDGAYRLIWLADGVALDARSIRVHSASAPQIVKVFPPQGSEVSAGSLLDIWVDAESPLASVSVSRDGQSRSAVYLRDTLGYKVYRDTLQAGPPGQTGRFTLDLSAADETGAGPATSLGDNNPVQLAYLYTTAVQPFAISGVKDGDLSALDYRISVRPYPNLIRYPVIRLDGAPFTEGLVTGEGNHELVLSGILSDGRSYTRSLNFALDKSGPEITVENIQEGQILDHAVAPVIRVWDLRNASHQVFLDGRAWDGGAIGDGEHSLLINARDSLDNVSDLRLSFRVVLPAGKFVRINPPLHGSYHNRTVFPDIETNLDDVSSVRVGGNAGFAYDTLAWTGFTDIIGADSIVEWASAAITGSWWSRTNDTNFSGFGPNGRYYAKGVETDSLATWASEGPGADRGEAVAFPESVVVVSSDSGISLVDSRDGSLWMRFRIDYAGGSGHPIHRPLRNLKFLDGWLFGFWDEGLVMVSFVNDRIMGWNGRENRSYVFDWRSGIADRNAGVPPTTLTVGWYSHQMIDHRDAYQMKPYIRHYQWFTKVELASAPWNLSITVDGARFDHPVSMNTYNSYYEPGHNQVYATLGGKAYHFSHYYANDNLFVDTLSMYRSTYQGQPIWYLTSGSIWEGSTLYGNLAPDAHLDEIQYAFGHASRSKALASISFLSPTYLQTTYHNFLEPETSLPKRMLKIGTPPSLPLGERGIDTAEWQVAKGALQLRDGLLFVDTTRNDTAAERMRLIGKRFHLADFQTELTVRNTDAYRTNNYLRIAFKDTAGVEQIRVFVGAQVNTSRWYGNSYYPLARWITTGFGAGDRNEMPNELHGAPTAPVLDYRLRMLRVGGKLRVFVWAQDKWEELKVNQDNTVRKVPLRMEVSSWCYRGDNFERFHSTGTPSYGFRVDSYEELNTTYLPGDVQSLIDAIPLEDQMVLRSRLQDGSTQYLAFDTASRAVTPMHEPFTEDAGHKLLFLGPGKFLAQDGNRFSILQQRDVDPIMPFDSVSAEGRHTLLAEVHSRSRGTFRDTSHFVIDKSPPNVAVAGVTDGGFYSASVTPVITVQDMFLDASRSRTTLNGVEYRGGAIAMNGAYALRIKAVDSAGNVRDSTVRFTLADKLRRLRPNTVLTVLEDTPDSSLDVSGLFAPSSDVFYTIAQAPDLATGLLPDDHLFVRPAPGFTGFRNLVISASYQGAVLADTVRVVVRPSDNAPRLLSSDTVKGVGGETISHRIVVVDPDDQVAFTVAGLPSWLTLQRDVLTGQAPVSGYTGTATLSISSGTASLALPLYIRIYGNNTPPSIAPRVTADPAYAGQSVTLDLRGHGRDVEDDTSTLTWTWGGSPHLTFARGLTKDQFIVHPVAGFDDTTTVLLILRDPHGATSTQPVLFDFTLDDGPVATFLKHWFPFNERQGTTAGDIRGGLAFTVPSTSWSPDTGLSLAGAASTAPTALRGGEGLSAEAWVKLDALSADADILTLTEGGFEVFRLAADGQDIRVAESLSDTVLFFSFPNAIPRDNAWQHLAICVRQDSVALYRNGILFGALPRPSLPVPDLSPSLKVGEGGASIALLRVYERYLTAGMVRHNHATAERQAGLVAVHEAEEPFRSQGAQFAQNPITGLPSRIALGTSDSGAQQCLFTPADSNFLEFKVFVPANGTYFLLGKTRGAVNDNSFFVQVDGGAPQIWNLPFDGRFGTTWFKDVYTGNPIPMHLVQGNHRIRILAREAGSLVDWIGVANRDDLRLPFVENPRWK